MNQLIKSNFKLIGVMVSGPPPLIKVSIGIRRALFIHAWHGYL